MDVGEGRAAPLDQRALTRPLAVVVALTLAVGGALGWMRAVNDGSEPDGRNWWLLAWTVMGAFALAVAVVVRRRHASALLWSSLGVVGVAAFVAALSTQYRAFATQDDGGVRWSVLAAPSEWAWQVGSAVFVVLTPWQLLPPDGRRRRIGTALRWLGVAGIVVMAVLAIDRGLERDRSVVENVARWAVAIAATVNVVGLARRRWRGRRSSDDALAGWLLAGVVVGWLAVVPDLVDAITWSYPGQHVVPPMLLLGTVPLLVVGTMIHVVRRGATGAARASHRAIEWALYSAAIVLLYTGVVAGLGRLVGGDGPTWFLVAATGVIAVLAEPARQQVRHLVDRLVYGSRDDPLMVVRRVVDHVGTDAGDELLPELVVSLQRELRLDAVAIDVVTPTGWERVASTGPATAHRRDVALHHGGEEVGRLVLGWDVGPPIRLRDERVLGELAGPVSLAVGWVRLLTDLRRSGAAVVSAQEDERRRLRRDLHDGVGPTLTGVSLGLRTAAKRVRRLGPVDASDDAHELLVRLADEVDGAVVEIKRIVRDLRPTALDELGLAAAVTEFARRLDEELDIRLELPGAPVSLPAVVEIAAYRITTEAITNVVRHAGATRCSVRIVTGDTVQIDVVDDGVGIDGRHHDGVGITAMRERVGHLGGELRFVADVDRGTHLHVSLPVLV